MTGVMTPEYHRQKSKDHYQKYKAKYNERNQGQKMRTKALLLEAKKGGCIQCSEMEPACLDFHHLGDKDKTVSQMRGMSDERVLDEIAKCVIVCANCHRKIHAGLIQVVLPEAQGVPSGC